MLHAIALPLRICAVSVMPATLSPHRTLKRASAGSAVSETGSRPEPLITKAVRLYFRATCLGVSCRYRYSGLCGGGGIRTFYVSRPEMSSPPAGGTHARRAAVPVDRATAAHPAPRSPHAVHRTGHRRCARCARCAPRSRTHARGKHYFYTARVKNCGVPHA